MPPNTDAAFLREVDDELRRDEIARAWKRYGVAALGAVGIAIAGFGGWQLWQSHEQTVAGDEGQALTKAQAEIGSPTAAADLDKLASSHVAGYRALALMGQGDALIARKDLRGAAAKFGAVAGDISIGAPLRDLALVRQTTAEFDTLKPDLVVARLRGIATKGNPWFGSAGELVAISYLRMGRRDLAGTLYGQIAQDPDMNPTTRTRAVQMAGVLGVDATGAKGQKSQ